MGAALTFGLRGYAGLAAVTVAFVAAAGQGAAAPTRDLASPTVPVPVTKQLRAELRAAFLRSHREINPSQIVGPLWGRPCLTAMEDMSRRDCIQALRYVPKKVEYASALFKVLTEDDRAHDQTFDRRVRGVWKTRGGFGYSPPLPCPVLKAWGREC